MEQSQNPANELFFHLAGAEAASLPHDYHQLGSVKYRAYAQIFVTWIVEENNRIVDGGASDIIELVKPTETHQRAFNSGKGGRQSITWTNNDARIYFIVWESDTDGEFVRKTFNAYKKNTIIGQALKSIIDEQAERLEKKKISKQKLVGLVTNLMSKVLTAGLSAIPAGGVVGQHAAGVAQQALAPDFIENMRGIIRDLSYHPSDQVCEPWQAQLAVIDARARTKAQVIMELPITFKEKEITWRAEWTDADKKTHNGVMPVGRTGMEYHGKVRFYFTKKGDASFVDEQPGAMLRFSASLDRDRWDRMKKRSSMEVAAGAAASVPTSPEVMRSPPISDAEREIIQLAPRPTFQAKSQLAPEEQESDQAIDAAIEAIQAQRQILAENPEVPLRDHQVASLVDEEQNLLAARQAKPSGTNGEAKETKETKK